MQSNRSQHVEWIWVAGLVFLVSLHFDWLPRLSRGPQHDTYSAAAEGKKAFYLLARQRGYDVTRNSKRLSMLLDSLDENSFGFDTLCLLGPARYPTAGEWERLMRWVAEGGTLLVAARSGSGGETIDFEIPELNVGVKKNSGAFETRSIATPVMTSGEFIWHSAGEIDTEGTSGLEILVETDDTVQAVGLPHGGGQLIVVASDFVFTNQSLAWSDYSNAELAIRLFDQADNAGDIYIDESLNSSGTPKVVGLMLEPFLWPVTVQMMIGLLLFAWWRSRRFGALRPKSVPARHNIVDHTDTLGMLYFKSGSGALPLKSYLKQFEGELRLSSAKGVEERALAPVAARLGKSVKAVRKVFARARKYADYSQLDRKTAARIIRRLALIRHAISQPAQPATSSSGEAEEDE